MEIETKRLYLRHWRSADAEALYMYAKDPDVGPSAGWPPHGSVEDSRNVIERALQGEECYAICLRGTDAPIGCIELKKKGDPKARELGFWLGKPFWGQGYMPEAVEALLYRGFEQMGLETILCGYYEGNAKSKRAQEKCGFRFKEKRENQRVALLSEYRNAYINSMTRQEWLEHKQK